MAQPASFHHHPPISAQTLVGEWEAIDLPGAVYFLNVRAEAKAVLVKAPIGGKPQTYALQNMEVTEGKVQLSFEGVASITLTGTGVAGEDATGAAGVLELEAGQVTKTGVRDTRQLVFRKTHLAEGLFLAMKAARSAAAVNE